MNTWAWGVPPGMLAGGPGSREYIIVVIALWKEYHCCTFRGSIERRRVPQVRFLNLGPGLSFSFHPSASMAKAHGPLRSNIPNYSTPNHLDASPVRESEDSRGGNSVSPSPFRCCTR